MMTLFFNPQPVVDWPSADRSDRKRFAQYFWGLIERGVYMPCSQFEALFFSKMHTNEDIDRTIQAASEIFSEMSRQEA
jgi:glutamate-1-semialdehyde 2,1-aminomutase